MRVKVKTNIETKPAVKANEVYEVILGDTIKSTGCHIDTGDGTPCYLFRHEYDIVEDTKPLPEVGGTKYDTGKPDFTYISYEFMEGLARVREFGAKKYTRYGECNCVLNVMSKNNTQKNYAEAAMISNLNLETQNTKKDKQKIPYSGQKVTEKQLISITKEGLETLQQCVMDLREQKLTGCSTKDVNYVEKILESVLTTVTQQEKSEALSAPRVTSVSDGSKNLGGLNEHAPTCNALKIVHPGRNNWKKGFKFTRSLAACLRHIFSFLRGENNDPESGLNHLYHAAACLEHAIYDFLHHPENDDRGET